MSLNKFELRTKVLIYYQDIADRKGSEYYSNCLSLIDKLGVTGTELGNAVEYLFDKGYIITKSLPGANLAEGMSKITGDGRDYLENPPTTNQQTPSVTNVVTFNGSVSNSQIAVGTNPLIEITNSFNKIRELPLTQEELEIVTEMEKNAKSEHPSIDAILEKGKSLWNNYGTSIKQEICTIGLALLKSQLGL